MIIDSSDMHTFTNSVLKFWRNNAHKFPTWSKAARIMVRAQARARARARARVSASTSASASSRCSHQLHPPPRPRPVQFAMTPNSAGAERVFSLLKNMFPKECNLSLADLIEGSLMLKYNNAKRAAEKLAARA